MLIDAFPDMPKLQRRGEIDGLERRVEVKSQPRRPGPSMIPPRNRGMDRSSGPSLIHFSTTAAIIEARAGAVNMKMIIVFI